MGIERSELEREADRLGIVWSAGMTDLQIHSLIHARNLDLDLSTFPELPECFGLVWDEPTEPECRECPARMVCFAVFTEAISQQPIEGRDLEDQAYALGMSLGVSLDAVMSALRARLPVDDPSQKKEHVPLNSQEAAEAVEAALPDPEHQSGAETAAKRRKRAPQRPPPAGVDPLPTMAQSAKLAAVLGGLASKRVEIVRGWDGVKRPEKQLPYRTWALRRVRERERSPLIAMLSPGMLLVREYKGAIHRVLVRSGDFLYLNEMRPYPTLYAVTKAIAGVRVRKSFPKKQKLCPWSSARFWSLRRLLLTERHT